MSESLKLPLAQGNQPTGFQTPQERLKGLLNLPFVDAIGLTVVFLAGFLNLVDVADSDKVGLDPQVLAKLAVVAAAGLYGAWGFLVDARVRDTLFSFPMLFMLLIIGSFLVAAPGSIVPAISLASALAMVCITLMTVTALIQLGGLRVLTTMFYAVALFVVLSWVAYLAWPAVGVYAEPLAEGQFKMRMSGLAHPNTLGQFCGLTIVIGSLLYTRFNVRAWVLYACLLLAIIALAGSFSRTSMLATACGLLIVFRDSITKVVNLFSVVLMLLIVAIGLLVASSQAEFGEKIHQTIAKFGTKSGDASELTSATGRAEIWAYTARKVAQRPLTGYGAATSPYYLDDYSSYTHNMIMNVAFSTGIFGGLMALLMVLDRVAKLLIARHSIADALIVFIIVNGLFENVMFSFLAGMPTMVWIVGLCLPVWMPENSNSKNLDADVSLGAIQ